MATVKAVTDVKKLKVYMEGQTVELPDFAEGQPFIARVRRPSMLTMMREGKIPNTLVESANQLFLEGASAMEGANEEKLKQVFEVLDLLCEATFVAPTWKELVDNDIKLTDEQYMFIFSYAQQGVKALENFR